MLTEIIRKPTKSDENMMKLSDDVLTWAKRNEVQRAQVAVINSVVHEVKNFDAILQKDEGKQRQTKLAIHVKQPVIRRCKYCNQVHKPRRCLAYGKRYENCKKMNNFKVVCRI